MSKEESDSLEDFFNESPLFEEYRRREKEELKLYEEERMREKEQIKLFLLNYPNLNIEDEFLRCKNCHSFNIDLRRRLQIGRRDEDNTIMYYCLNCHEYLK